VTALAFTRDDDAAPRKAPGERAYLFHVHGHVRGVVAGSGRSWFAGPIPPSRTRIPSWTVWGETRSAVAERMTRGRP
jgi:hypothetical protein